MTQEQLIKAINENEDAWSCPELYNCDMPEEEGNTGECCMKCAEKQLKEYEDKIRAEAINEFAHALKETFNNEFPSDYHCTQPYFTLDNVRVLVDAVAKEQSNE